MSTAYRSDEIDVIDHHPETLRKAEEAAKNAHLDGLNAEQAQAATGTVNLLHRYGQQSKDNIVLIPAPTADPQDPLNLPLWRRVALLVMLQIFASFGQSAVSAFATLQPFLEDEYIEQEGKNDQDILNLSVMPTLTQGLSNLALGPLVIAFGRRPVYLFANFLMILSCILAANNTNFEQHLAYRLMMGASVGIGQTLVPLMVKESFFLHQRGTWLAYSGTINSVFGLVWGMFIPNVVDQVGWRNLYYIDAGILSFFFLIGIFLMPETKYERTLEAFNGLGYGKQSAAAQPGRTSPELDDDKEKAVDEQYEQPSGGLIQITALTRPDIDNVNFRPRTWLSDLRPVQRSFDLPLALTTFKNCFQILLFPNVLILCVVNFWFLTMTIVHSATYPRVLIAPPNNWPRGNIGYIQGGAVIDIILTPILLGWCSDWLSKFFAKRNHGVHEPETRFLTFLLPMCLGWVSMILHGYMQKYPERIHWSAQLFFFGFLNAAFSGTAIGTQTVLLDSYPTRSAATLIIINTFRGALAFAFMSSFGKTIGDLGGPYPAWGKFGAIGAGLTVAVLILFFVGKRIRLFTLRFVVDTDKAGQAKNNDS